MPDATTSPTVSVVIPTYNRACLVSRAVQSAIRQTYTDFEIIIVDDASTDDTEAVIDDLTDERLRYVCHAQNRGAAATRNTGVEAARGIYVGFLDSDDEWLPQKLEKQLHVFRENPDVAVVYAAYVMCEDGRAYRTRRLAPVEGLLEEQLLCDICGIVTSSALAKRSCLLRAGGFDEQFPTCEEWDLWIRMARRWSFGHVGEVLMRYHQHDGAERLSMQQQNMINGLERILEKHRSRIEALGPSVVARYYFRMAQRYCYAGVMNAGRRHFRKTAAASRRWLPRVLVHLGMTLLGRTGYVALSSTRRKIARYFRDEYVS